MLFRFVAIQSHCLLPSLYTCLHLQQAQLDVLFMHGTHSARAITNIKLDSAWALGNHCNCLLLMRRVYTAYSRIEPTL